MLIYAPSSRSRDAKLESDKHERATSTLRHRSPICTLRTNPRNIHRNDTRSIELPISSGTHVALFTREFSAYRRVPAKKKRMELTPLAPCRSSTRVLLRRPESRNIRLFRAKGDNAGVNFAEPLRNRPTMVAEFTRPATMRLPVLRETFQFRDAARETTQPTGRTVARALRDSAIHLAGLNPTFLRAPSRRHGAGRAPRTPGARRASCCSIRASRNIGCISRLYPEGRPIRRPRYPLYVSLSTVLCTPLATDGFPSRSRLASSTRRMAFLIATMRRARLSRS